MLDGRTVEQAQPLALSDFVAYLPAGNFIFMATREAFPAGSVNARVLPVLMGNDEKGKPKYLPASQWLSSHQAAEQMTWAPGEPDLIRGRVVADGRWVKKEHCTVLNMYRPPIVTLGDPDQAGRWIDHCRKIYPNDYEHIIDCLAHCVQNPAGKINHGLVLGGLQGIGKDSLLDPVKHAVGHWNWAEVSPQTLMGRFNPHVKSVILRVNEAHDLGDLDRYGFYEHCKTLTAAPPDVHRCEEKHAKPYSVQNVCFVIITTNHKTDGLFLPADDRRHFVAWSDITRDDLTPEYWTSLHRWYADKGVGHVAAYLWDRDISEFDPKAPPPQTKAFWDIVDANRPAEDADLADIIEKLSYPKAVTIERIASIAESTFAAWLKNPANAKKIAHRMAAVGYERERNEGQRDGRWKIGDDNRSIYVRRELSTRERAAAIEEFIAPFRGRP